MSKNIIIQNTDENISHAINEGVVHLETKAPFEHNHLIIDNNNVISFSSYSYLALEGNAKVINGSITAVQQYGTQFGYSRAFIEVDLYRTIEEKFEDLFQTNVIMAPSTTLAHQSALPIMIGEDDLVLIDQYSHASIFTTMRQLTDRGTKMEIVRHNRTDLIEDKLKSVKASSYSKIWYLCDSIYSMHGDYSPLQKLENLSKKYSKFHLYIDDAHGMSWTGTNGTGYAMDRIQLNSKMVVVVSLNKAFAALGGLLLIPDPELKRKIRNCGSTLIFSTPIPPPMLGAAMGSIDMHLSGEISKLQEQLKQNIAHCKKHFLKLNLPELSNSDSPIFFLPCAYPKVSFFISKTMLQEGYYLTPTTYPAVSPGKSGIRICINAEHTKEEITNMLNSLKKSYIKALRSYNVKPSLINKTFRIDHTFDFDIKQKEELTIRYYTTIQNIESKLWKRFFDRTPIHSWENMKMLEEVYSNNDQEEHNWFFHYFFIKDENGTVRLATSFTECIIKDDVFDSQEISKKVEMIRKSDKYFLCSKSLVMGTPITEGDHLYLNNCTDQVLQLLLDSTSKLQEKRKINSLILRDFDENETELSKLFISNGFAKTNLPDYSHILHFEQPLSFEGYYGTLTSRKRNEINKGARNLESKFDISIHNSLCNEDLKHCRRLYLNTQSQSYTLNTFPLPLSFFEAINEDSNWEFIILKLSPSEYLNGTKQSIVSFVISHKTSKAYTPLYLGMDYAYNRSHSLYKQTIFQIVKRAIQLKTNNVYFGLTGSRDKKRLGAKAKKKKVFIHFKDSYNRTFLSNISYQK